MESEAERILAVITFLSLVWSVRRTGKEKAKRERKMNPLTAYSWCMCSFNHGDLGTGRVETTSVRSFAQPE